MGTGRRQSEDNHGDNQGTIRGQRGHHHWASQGTARGHPRDVTLGVSPPSAEEMGEGTAGCNSHLGDIHSGSEGTSAVGARWPWGHPEEVTPTPRRPQSNVTKWGNWKAATRGRGQGWGHPPVAPVPLPPSRWLWGQRAQGRPQNEATKQENATQRPLKGHTNVTQMSLKA